MLQIASLKFNLKPQKRGASVRVSVLYLARLLLCSFQTFRFKISLNWDFVLLAEIFKIFFFLLLLANLLAQTSSNELVWWWNKRWNTEKEELYLDDVIWKGYRPNSRDPRLGLLESQWHVFWLWLFATLSDIPESFISEYFH